MLVVVGGHSRNIGKTSVVSGVIRALPDWHWTAIKITHHRHGVCSKDGEPCECADPVHPVSISEENGSAPSTDSGRFLAAGAKRAFWVRTPSGQLLEGMARVRCLIDEAENVIVESNSILQFLKPDFCAMVVDGSVADFKPTTQRFLDRADVLVVTSEAPLAWAGVPDAVIGSKPQFAALAPSYESAALIDSIRDAALAIEPARFSRSQPTQ